MAEQDQLVTVFRSADHSAAEQAEAVQSALREAGIESECLDDNDPGVAPGAVEVRVAPERAEEAEQIRERALARLEELGITHDLDLVSVFSSDAHDGEMEAMTVEGLLKSNGVDAILIGPSVLPVLAFEVHVPKEDYEKALSIIEEAKSTPPPESGEETPAAEG